MKISILATAALALVAVLAAAEPWEKKPWGDWNREEAMQVLQNSPWAVDHYLNDVVVARLVWRSSRPVRLAQARLFQIGNPAAPAERAQQYIDQPIFEQYLTVGLEFWVDRDRAAPSQLIAGREAGFDAGERFLKELLRLQTSNTIKDYVYLIKRDNTRIPAERYVGPNEGSTQGLFFFPRSDGNGQPHLQVDDDEIVFTVEAVPLGLRIRRKFDLEKMQFEGQLTL